MLEVGAFHPAWGDIHLGPEHALEALQLLGGGKFLPVHWGTFNLAVAYVLICRVGDFDLHSTVHVGILGLGFLLLGLFCGHHFGRFHGGNAPGEANDIH